jgi:hypothetical protein
MISSALYQELVPDARSFKRTEGDPPKTSLWKSRLETGAFLKLSPSALEHPELISTYKGTIEKLLFAFPKFALAEPESVAAYKSVISALRVGTKFVIVHHPDGKSVIKNWFTSAGHDLANVTFVELPDYVMFTDWAEDAYVSLIDSGSGIHYLMEPWEFKRAGDALIADAIEENTDTVASQAPLIFQGGNCLVTDMHWLLGKDYFADSIETVQGPRPPVSIPEGEDVSNFVKRLFKDYVDERRELIVVGTDKPIPIAAMRGTEQQGAYFLDLPSGGAGTFQPIFHIDMFLTPFSPDTNGRPRFLVGDPTLADQILGTSSPFSLPDIYDKIAVDLMAAGFAVTRNPLVHRAATGRSFTIKQLSEIAAKPGNEDLVAAIKELRVAGATASDEVTIREWHHITWNNCLVEASATEGDHVYLPTFGHGANVDLEAIDSHMKHLWEGFGFTTHMLGDFNSFAERQGVVHCIKKYLRRSK